MPVQNCQFQEKGPVEWAKEVEDRIDAYDQGEIKAVTLKEVLEKYK